ncbi:MAG: hypothetical protein V1918_10530 [Planctomycetota bacterium]
MDPEIEPTGKQETLSEDSLKKAAGAEDSLAEGAGAVPGTGPGPAHAPLFGPPPGEALGAPLPKALSYGLGLLLAAATIALLALVLRLLERLPYNG